jgi:hypothetical protein
MLWQFNALILLWILGAQVSLSFLFAFAHSLTACDLFQTIPHLLLVPSSRTSNHVFQAQISNNPSDAHPHPLAHILFTHPRG